MPNIGFWATAGAGGGAAPAAYELISTSLISTNTASVTFDVSTFASTYKHLQVRYVTRSNQSANETFPSMRLNADTGSNYSWHYLLGSGSGSPTSSSGVSTTSIALPSMTTANSTANAFGAGVVDILDPFSTTKYKTVRALGGHLSVSTIVSLFSGNWRSTSAVTSVSVIADAYSFVSGSRISLYGIRG